MTTSPSAGQTLNPLSKQMTKQRIDGWAALSGDFNRLHVDQQYAAQTHFKGVIAHGPMSLAFLNELMMANFPDRWPRGGVLTQVRFLAPVRPGYELSISGAAEEPPEDAGEMAAYRLSINGPNGDLLVTGLALLPGKEQAS